MRAFIATIFKPRIKRLGDAWRCTNAPGEFGDLVFFGYGDTPKAAYEAWIRHLIWRQR